jgi:tetratricopeptide (TPR) repeat protein
MALKMAEDAGEPQALAQAHNMMGILARKRRELDTARFHLQSSLDIAASLNQLGMHVAALNNLALTLADDGQFEQSQQLFEDALKLCIRQQDRHHEAALQNHLADLFHTMKQPEAAMAHLKRAVALFAQIGVEGGAMRPEIWKLAEW